MGAKEAITRLSPEKASCMFCEDEWGEFIDMSRGET
jgi:hypothetical protein